MKVVTIPTFVRVLLFVIALSLVSDFTSSLYATLLRCYDRPDLQQDNISNSHEDSSVVENEPSHRSSSFFLYAEAQPFYRYNGVGWLSGAPFRWALALNNQTVLNYTRYYMQLIGKDLQIQLQAGGDNVQAVITVTRIVPREGKSYVPEIGCDVYYTVANTKFADQKALNDMLAGSPMTNLALDPGAVTFFSDSSKLRWIPCTPSDAMVLTRSDNSSTLHRYLEAVNGSSMFWSVANDTIANQEYTIAEATIISQKKVMPMLELLVYLFQEDMQIYRDPLYSDVVIAASLPEGYVNASAFFIRYDVYLTKLTTANITRWEKLIQAGQEEAPLNASLFYTPLTLVNEYYETYKKDNPDTVEEYFDLIPSKLQFRPFRKMRNDTANGMGEGTNAVDQDTTVVDGNCTTILLYFTGVADGWSGPVGKNISAVVSRINHAVSQRISRLNYTYTVGVSELRVVPVDGKDRKDFISYYPPVDPLTNNITALTAEQKDAHNKVVYNNDKNNELYKIGLIAFVEIYQGMTNSSQHPWNTEELAVTALYADYLEVLRLYDTQFDYKYGFYYNTALDNTTSRGTRAYKAVGGDMYESGIVLTPALYSAGTLYNLDAKPLRFIHTAGMVYMGVGIVGAMLVAFIITVIVVCTCMKDPKVEEEVWEPLPIRKRGSITDSLVERIVLAVRDSSVNNSKMNTTANKEIQVDFISTSNFEDEDERMLMKGKRLTDGSDSQARTTASISTISNVYPTHSGDRSASSVVIAADVSASRAPNPSGLKPVSEVTSGTVKTMSLCAHSPTAPQHIETSFQEDSVSNRTHDTTSVRHSIDHKQPLKSRTDASLDSVFKTPNPLQNRTITPQASPATEARRRTPVLTSVETSTASDGNKSRRGSKSKEKPAKEVAPPQNNGGIVFNQRIKVDSSMTRDQVSETRSGPPALPLSPHFSASSHGAMGGSLSFPQKNAPNPLAKPSPFEHASPLSGNMSNLLFSDGSTSRPGLPVVGEQEDRRRGHTATDAARRRSPSTTLLNQSSPTPASGNTSVSHTTLVSESHNKTVSTMRTAGEQISP
ncbi:hypothetical protein ADEAN_000822200 [Angomonas deanei]|uniref:Uncharacterized protein n=1 Tax=Angomonas deanei TaxID=59799 RepID=A0A7G2CLH2_9TRYP|nr:hypothetical protein ADEAN_000822200 [Angomonas deanei]